MSHTQSLFGSCFQEHDLFLDPLAMEFQFQRKSIVLGELFLRIVVGSDPI
jgi:hypothetical protein